MVVVMAQIYPVQARTYFSNSNYTWDAFPRPLVSSDFQEQERYKIWKSLLKAQAIIKSTGTGSIMEQCIKKYVNISTGEYDGKAPATGALVRVSSWPVLTNRKLYIDQFTHDRYLGLGLLGIINFNSPKDVDFKIELNSTMIPQYSENVIAGIIVHEILHNWGYQHSRYDTTNNWEDARGNFVYEVGWCVTREGKDKPPGSVGLTGEAAGEFFVD